MQHAGALGPCAHLSSVKIPSRQLPPQSQPAAQHSQQLPQQSWRQRHAPGTAAAAAVCAAATISAEPEQKPVAGAPLQDSNGAGGPKQARRAPAFPFVRLSGQDEMKLALLLNVIDSRIGGVLIMGDRGTGKSVAVRVPASGSAGADTSICRKHSDRGDCSSTKTVLSPCATFLRPGYLRPLQKWR